MGFEPELRLVGEADVLYGVAFGQLARQGFSRSVNYRGGDLSGRVLGFELDGSIRAHAALWETVTLSGGVEGGVYVPGDTLNDAAGVAMGPVGLVRVRFGLSY